MRALGAEERIMSLKFGLWVLLWVSAVIVIIAGFSTGHGWLFVPFSPLGVFAGKKALVMWRDRGESVTGPLDVADHWPSRLVRYVIALSLCGIGFWVSLNLYVAVSGPFIWFLVSSALMGAGITFLMPEISALVTRSATPKDHDDE